jgi:hypothetical protein
MSLAGGYGKSAVSKGMNRNLLRKIAAIFPLPLEEMFNFDPLLLC